MAKQNAQTRPETKGKARPYRKVFTVVEGEKDPQGNSKDYWHQLGRAFDNKDGSQTILLNALPLTPRLIIRPAEPDTDDETGAPKQ